MTTILEHYGMNPVGAGYIPKKLAPADEVWKIASGEVIGIEIEVENQIHRRPSNSVWTVVEDGSLRNGGIEFISKPIGAGWAPAALHHLFTQDLDNGMCFSPRTSTHVHVNVQDLTQEQVIDLVMVYALFEKALYRFVGKSRWKNIYCTPITETNYLPLLGDMRMNVPWEKYTGLNLCPISTKGTLEFRHMHGTPDVKKLCLWIDLITRLKGYVKSHTTAEIRRTIIGFNGGQVHQIAVDVFGELADYLNISDPYEVVSRLPTIKLALLKSSLLNRAYTKTVDLTSKFFTV